MRKTVSFVFAFVCLLLTSAVVDAGYYATHRQRPVIYGLQIGTSQSQINGGYVVGNEEAIVLSRGQPYILYPVFLDDPYACKDAPQTYPYTASKDMWQYNRYSTSPVFLYQPYLYSPANQLGPAQWWDNIAKHTDVFSPGFMTAGAAMDNNNIWGDYSMNPGGVEANPYFADGTGWSLLVGTRTPLYRMAVTVHTGDFAGTGQYNIPASIAAVNQPGKTQTHCNGASIVHYSYQQIVVNSGGRAFNWGDAGSPIVTDGRDGGPANLLVGWLEWVNLANNYQGGGSDVNIARQGMRFDNYFTDKSGVLDSILSPQTSSALPVGGTGCSLLYVTNANRSSAAQKVSIYLTKDPYSPATFTWYNPAGVQAVAYDIPASGVRGFKVCLTSTARYAVSDYRFVAYGPDLGTGQEASLSPVVKTALNTMMARWDATAHPNFQISQLSTTNNDIAHTGGIFGSTLIKIKATNIGTADVVTIGTDTVTLSQLPLDATVCETTSSYASCLQPFQSHFSKSWAAGATKYFLIALAGQGTIVPLDKFNNRIYFRVYQGVSTLHNDMIGSASLAATTS